MINKKIVNLNNNVMEKNYYNLMIALSMKNVMKIRKNYYLLAMNADYICVNTV
jgi:hypothetical protein